MYFLNTGLRYSFDESRGTFSLNFSDVFNTMRFGVNGDRPFTQNGIFNWESQNLYIGFSYRFGGGKYRAKQRRNRDDNTKKSSGGIF